MARRTKVLIAGGAALVVLLAAGAVFALTRPPGDVENPDVAFRDEPAETPEPTPTPGTGVDPLRDFVWAQYGYGQDRRHVFAASKALRPPFRRVWTLGGKVLLEFPPVMAQGKLFLLKNNGALYAVDKRTGKVRWKRKLGVLAAASPALGKDRLFVTVLSRGKGKPGAVYALTLGTGKVLWRRLLPSRSESSPVVAGDRVYLGSESGKVYALRTADGGVEWTHKAKGAVKAALALGGGKVYFGDYSGRVSALRMTNGHKLWTTRTKGGALGLRAGQFYSSPAVAYGRVYVGNTDGRMYSFSSDNGKLAWAKRTKGYVYASPAVGSVDGLGPTVWFGSYDGSFYALNAKNGAVRWRHKDGGKISGSPTLVGDVVYYSNLGKKDTTGLGARTGREVFHLGRGSFNPVITDGRTIFLTGYSSLYALRPRR